MAWSYVGLLAAAVSEIATRYFRMRFEFVVGVAAFAVVAAGAVVIRRRLPHTLSRTIGD